MGSEDKGGAHRPYTAILPARHPAPHLRLALDGLRALRPSPDEIIVGLDSDDRVLGGLIPDWPSITVLRIPPSERYGMPLAHVLVECARAARNDLLLFTNADIRLEQRTMEGLPMIGPPGNIAWVSHSERWPVRSPGDWLRWRHYQRQLRGVENPMTGNYWIWRPYMFDAVPQEDFESISDGIDTLILQEARRGGVRRARVQRERIAASGQVARVPAVGRLQGGPEGRRAVGKVARRSACDGHLRQDAPPA